MKNSIYVYKSDELFDLSKPRYNAYAYGNGKHLTAKDKAKNRNSKSEKAFKNSLKEYCY